MKLSRLVVEGHSEETVYQMFYLGSNFYFMTSRILN